METCGREKFDSIYNKYKGRVFATALGYMKNQYEAEEIFQETFLELYKQIDKICLETAENWLLTVAKNKSINQLKKLNEEKDKVENLEEGREAIPSNMYGNLQKIEKDHDYNELGIEIFDELYRENSTWYTAIVRVYCHGEAQKKVAGEMGMNMKRFHSMLFRARGWIKRHYGERYRDLHTTDY